MSRKFLWLLLSCAIATVLVFAACGQKGTTTTTTTTSKSAAAAETPVYGGTINDYVGGDTFTTVFDPNRGASHGYTSFMMYETLATADFSKGPGGTNEWPFDGVYIPDQYKTYNLADSWQFIDLQTMKFHIRPGVRFQNIAPVNGRELEAADVKWTTDLATSTATHFLYASKPEDRVQITVDDKYNFTVKWPFPYTLILHDFGTYLQVVPHELMDEYKTLNDWKHQVGTGPFMISDVVASSGVTMVKNPNYWRNDPYHPKNKLPYADKVSLLVIKEFNTAKSAFRTGKLDLLRYVGIDDFDEVKNTTPNAKWRTLTGASPTLLWMQTQYAPFNDVRVRQAVALAIDEPKINQTLNKGQGIINFWPLQPSAGKAYVPYEQLPANVKKFYEAHPDEGKKLLADAGFPTGFKAELAVGNNAAAIDLAALMKEQLLTVGIDVTIKTYEDATFTDLLYGGGYRGFILASWGNVRPVDVFGWAHDGLESVYAFSRPSDPLARAAWAEYNKILDANQRDEFLKKETFREMELCWEVQLPSMGSYRFWQPWVKNYWGERGIGPEDRGWGEVGIYQYIWLDKALKTKMGITE